MEEAEGETEEGEAEEEMAFDEDGTGEYKKGEEGALTVKDKKKVARDSAPLKAAFASAVSGAEIIAPGIKMPTFDSASNAKSTTDSICLIKRRALAASIRSADGADVFKQVTGNSKLKPGMTCDALGVVFNAIVALTKDKNDITKNSNDGKSLFGRGKTKDANAQRFSTIKNPADFNAAARAKYGQPSRH